MKNKKLRNKDIESVNVGLLKEDWWLFCDNYLKIAELACREMIYQRYSIFEEIQNGRRAFCIYNLYFSALYNLKHSIEIYLKYFYISIKKQLPKDIEIHNLDELLKYFNKSYGVEIFNKAINSAYQQKIKSRYSLDAANLETEFSKEWIKNIIKITLKYFKCEDIKSKINIFNLRDLFNDAYRYPKNKLGVNLNYTEIIYKINKDDVKTVLDDIYELENAFNSLRFLFEVYEDINNL